MLVVSSGSIALGRNRLNCRAAPEARGKPGRGGRGPDRAGTDLVGSARRPRHQRRTDPGDLQDTEEHRRYLNARSTIAKLLEWRAVPVINENDTVATNKSATATMTASPRASLPWRRRPANPAVRHRRPLRRAAGANPNAKLVPVVRSVTSEIEAMAGAARSSCLAAACTPDRGRQDRDHRRHAHADCVGQNRASAASDRKWQALHLVPYARQSRHGAKTLDRGLAGPKGTLTIVLARSPPRAGRACCRPA